MVSNSIIFVGSRERPRDNRYYSKDNWGMYRQPYKKDSQNQLTSRDCLYLDICACGRKGLSNKNIHKESKKLEVKYPGATLKIETIIKVLQAYRLCFDDNTLQSEKEVRIKKNLESNLKRLRVNAKVITSIMNYENNKKDFIKRGGADFTIKSNIENKTSKINQEFYQKLHDYLIESMDYKKTMPEELNKEFTKRKRSEEYLDQLLKAYKEKKLSPEKTLAVINAQNSLGIFKKDIKGLNQLWK